MARKTVISKVLDVEAQDGIIEFPQNRALYADQFTDEAPQSDEDRAEFKAKNMKDVFEHYQPSKKGIALENEEGGAVYEDFDFKSLKDFEDEALIEQSALMGAAKDKIDAYNEGPNAAWQPQERPAGTPRRTRRGRVKSFNCKSKKVK